METLLTKLAEQSPGLGVALFMVIFFMRYIEKKDAATSEVFQRVEALHKITLDKIDANTMAFGTINSTILKCTKGEVKQ